MCVLFSSSRFVFISSPLKPLSWRQQFSHAPWLLSCCNFISLARFKVSAIHIYIYINSSTCSLLKLVWIYLKWVNVPCNNFFFRVCACVASFVACLCLAAFALLILLFAGGLCGSTFAGDTKSTHNSWNLARCAAQQHRMCTNVVVVCSMHSYVNFEGRQREEESNSRLPEFVRFKLSYII